MESRDYSITKCEPKIEKGRLEDCVERLNESRDLAGFLKGMRVLFSETL